MDGWMARSLLYHLNRIWWIQEHCTTRRSIKTRLCVIPHFPINTACAFESVKTDEEESRKRSESPNQHHVTAKRDRKSQLHISNVFSSWPLMPISPFATYRTEAYWSLPEYSSIYTMPNLHIFLINVCTILLKWCSVVMSVWAGIITVKLIIMRILSIKYKKI